MHCLPGDSVTHICSLKVVWHFPWHAAFPKSSWNVSLLSLCFSLQDSRQEGPGNPHPWLTDHLWIKPFSVQPAGDFKPPIANSRCPLILWANRQSGTKHSNVSTCIPRSFLLGAVWLRDRCIYDSSLLFFSLCSDQFPCGPVWFPSDIFSSNSLVMWWLRFFFCCCSVLFCFSKWDKLPPFFLPSPSPFFECLFGEGNCPYLKVQNSSTKCDALTLAPRGSYLMAGSLSTKWGAAREFLVCGELWFVASAGHYFVLA